MMLQSLWKSMQEAIADSDDPESDPTLRSFKSMAPCAVR